MGQNSQRNADRQPWENHFDFRIAQDFKVSTYKLQVFVDVLNIGALLNDNGDVLMVMVSYPDGFFPSTVNLFTPVVGAQKQDGVAITPTVNNPAFQFNINNFTKIGDNYRPYSVNNFTSRWSSQIGARFNF